MQAKSLIRFLADTKCRLFLAAVGCLLFSAMGLFAQSDRGTITGTILDPVGAVIPGAKVLVTNSETGAVYETVSTQTGNFTIPSVPAGVYSLSVETAGFKKYIQQNVRVQVAQTLRVDATLEVGTSSESITVTAEAPLLKTENAEQSVNLTGDNINSLPLNFGGGGGSTGQIRSPFNFVVLSPGISGGPGVWGFLAKTRINGTPGSSFKILVEGHDATSDNDTAWSSIATQPSVDMIQEFSLQTSNFAAEFGSVGGGVFNFTTRSGTNEFHGSAFEYLNNEALDAHRPFTYVRPKSRKHDFGFTVGGPVAIPKLYDGHNKTFFFFNLEMFRNRIVRAGTYNTVPTDAYRNGDFSAALTGRQLGGDGLGRPIMENTIYDPLTGRTIDGRIYRDPFLGNVIPKSRMDAVAIKIQSLFPATVNSDLINNWESRGSDELDQSIPAVKIDHNLGNSTKLSFYWSKQKTHKFASVDGLPEPLTAVRDQEIFSDTYRLNYDQTLTPTLLLHTGIGYRRFINPDKGPKGVLEYDAPSGIGFTGGYRSPTGFPRITGLSSSLGGMMNIGPTNAQQYYDDKLTGVASATYIRGNHTYKLGAEYRLTVFTNQNYGGTYGSLSFNAAQTGLPATQGQGLQGGSIGFPYASFLLGLVNSGSISAPQDPQWRKPSWGLFIQDTWKVTRKLTLDYGLRWDWQSQGHEIHWRNSGFSPETPNPSAGGRLGANAYEGYGSGRINGTFTKTYPYAVGPRLGAAYQINPKTVVRAGWGITYTPVANYYYGIGSLLGIGQNSISFSTPAYGEAAVVLKNGLQYDRNELTKVTLDTGIRPAQGQLNSPSNFQDPNGGRPGRIMQWSIGLQREVIRNLMVEASYVGNRGAWLTRDPWQGADDLVALNVMSAERLRNFGLDINNAADRQLLTSRIDSPLAASRGFKAPYAGFPGSATVAQTLRPYPQFSGSLVPRWAPLGNNWYDSLQVKITKRYSNGLDVTSSFTWQKELARGTGGGIINDVFNRENQKSLVNNSQPLVFVVGFTYEVPKLTESRLVRTVVGNWTLGGLVRYTSGYPIPVPGSSNSLSSLLYQSTVMNRVPGEPLYVRSLNGEIDPNKEFVLNPKAWSDPAAGQWGVSAPFYNDYRFARRPDEQLSLGRNFRIREKMMFQVRAEFFNVFNRTYLGDPSSGNPLETQKRNADGVPIAGFGRIVATSLANPPRNGQIVARFQW